MSDVTLVHCSHTGVAGTTKLYKRILDDGRIEVRTGIAIFGSTNMSMTELENANPFDSSFQDNYASGVGPTEESAIEALKSDMQALSDSLW